MSDIICRFNSERTVLKNISAAIFDLDGTLFDSMGVWKEIDIAFLKKRGYSVPNFYNEKICALSLKEAAEYTIKLFNLKESVKVL